jgi:hypothetical protein
MKRALLFVWAVVISILIMETLAHIGCGPGPSPSPSPSVSPTPTPRPTRPPITQPTPTPSPGPTPPPGDAPEFKIIDGKWSPQPFGMVGCCNTPPRDGSFGWTFAEPTEIDGYRSAGANLAVFRTGPYSDQGNGWGFLHAPPGQKSRLRRACEYANAKGVACLVEAGTDYWSLKNQNVEYQLYQDNCSVTHGPPPARYQRWTREVVHQTGDLRVLWSLGNEGWLCNPTKAWYDGIVNTIRQAEKDFGFPKHPIGSVWKAGEIGRNANGTTTPLYDFVEVHGPPENFCRQEPIDVPIIWTESENEYPPESVDRMLGAKDCADTSGGKKAALLWRGGIQDAEWDTLFTQLGGHAPARGGRTDSSCLWNKYEQTYNGDLGNSLDSETWKRKAAAIENVISLIGPESWLFTNGGNNLKSDGTVNDEYQRIDFFSLVDAMQDGCTIVGNPDAANSMWEVDNIEAFMNTDPCAQSGYTMAFHPIIFGNHPNWNQVQRGDKLKQYPSVFKGKQSWTATTPCYGPAPGPSPTPPPTTGPTPTPTVEPTPSPGTDPPESRWCVTLGQVCECWDKPPGQPWVWVQCCAECPGGICHTSAPTESCTGQPSPTPSPRPTPTPTNCGQPTSWRNVVKSNQANQQIDLTAVACGGTITDYNKNCGVRCCELSAEKGNAECADILYGQPIWTAPDGRPVITTGVRLMQVYGENSYTQKVAEGPETPTQIKACGKTADSCVYVDVVPVAPACNINLDPRQGCAYNVVKAKRGTNVRREDGMGTTPPVLGGGVLLKGLIVLAVVLTIVMLAIWSKLTPVWFAMLIGGLAFLLGWIAWLIGKR